jgi:hypothetical protein
MIPVDAAISRFRRDLTIAALLRAALLSGALACVLAGPMLGLHGQGMFVLMIIGTIWILLSYRSMQGTRLAADSPSLIAAGQFEQAEARIDTALRTFSLFRAAKVQSLHHLALLRHAQRRWRESTLLCQALMAQKLAGLGGLPRTTLLVMADSALQMGDLRGSFEAMNGLYGYRLSLPEALTLQLLQLDYGSRIGAWDQMLSGVAVKVQMSELMPGPNAARSQALLALAARKMGRRGLAQWLRRRAELLADPQEIAADRPVLAEMFREKWEIS